MFSPFLRTFDICNEQKRHFTAWQQGFCDMGVYVIVTNNTVTMSPKQIRVHFFFFFPFYF